MVKYCLKLYRGGNSMLKRLWNDYKSYIIGFLVLIAVVVFFWIFNIPCPTKRLIGMSCPGCGLSRAYFSVFKLNFRQAFWFHPLWPLMPLGMIAAIVLCIKNKLRTAATLLFCIFGIFITVWIIRILLGDSVVAFDVQNSLLGSAIQNSPNK